MERGIVNEIFAFEDAAASGGLGAWRVRRNRPFLRRRPPAQAYAGKTVTGEVTVKQTVEDTLQSHRGLKVMQENLDVVRHELRRAKAGWGPSVDAVGRTGASRLSNTTTRPFERR